jgi:2-polyprenyl-3-methyl-5-hydroxy-6-metoxy-1,4-benzoquinol methylase
MPARTDDGETSYSRAMMRIAGALPALPRAYAIIRFLILRVKLLAVMDLLLPPEGRVLDVGCGFGLWTAYFAQMHPERRFVGIDPSAARIDMARRVAEHVGAQAEFRAENIQTSNLDGPFDAAYLLDVLHHIPRADQVAVIERIHDLLVPGGVLIIKDVTTKPWLGLKFTEYLDRVMVGFDEELAYRHHGEWKTILENLGLSVRVVRVPDILPYPHVVIAATKSLDAPQNRK